MPQSRQTTYVPSHARLPIARLEDKTAERQPVTRFLRCEEYLREEPSMIPSGFIRKGTQATQKFQYASANKPGLIELSCLRSRCGVEVSSNAVFRGVG